MTENNPNINRVCSFYASDWHLLTMLLPNIDRKINEGVKITTILENDLTEKMETLLEKVRLKNKEKILNVTWNNKEINIENIKSITKDKDEIIISGSIEFIENVHKKIKECIENNSLQKENITIIVNPKLVENINKLAPSFRNEFPTLKSLRVVEDNSLSSDGVIVETPDIRLDSRVSSQIAEIANKMLTGANNELE